MQNKLIFGTGLSSAKDFTLLHTVINKCLESGIVSFDTAPSYGTERVLGEVLTAVMKERNISRAGIWVQSKIDAWQMQECNGKVAPYVYKAIEQMNAEYFDAVLIHWPIPEYFENTYATLKKLKETGVIRFIGVCNVRMRQLQDHEDELPDIVQIERNPLNTFSREIEFCKKNGIFIQDYSPLCKFHKDIAQSLELKQLAEKYGRSIGQIVLRWHIDTGASPIFTTQRPERVQEYANIFEFSLLDRDIQIINGLNKNYKMYLESVACPGF